MNMTLLFPPCCELLFPNCALQWGDRNLNSAPFSVARKLFFRCIAISQGHGDELTDNALFDREPVEPRLFFVHVFAQGEALKLALALRAALNVVGSNQSSIQQAPGPEHAASWR